MAMSWNHMLAATLAAAVLLLLAGAPPGSVIAGAGLVWAWKLLRRGVI
jgi:hypothetical protein